MTNIKTTMQSEWIPSDVYYGLGEEMVEEIKLKILRVLKSHGASLSQSKEIFGLIIEDIENTPLK